MPNRGPAVSLPGWAGRPPNPGCRGGKTSESAAWPACPRPCASRPLTRSAQSRALMLRKRGNRRWETELTRKGAQAKLATTTRSPPPRPEAANLGQTFRPDLRPALRPAAFDRARRQRQPSHPVTIRPIGRRARREQPAATCPSVFASHGPRAVPVAREVQHRTR